MSPYFLFLNMPQSLQFPHLGNRSHDLKVSVVVCWNNEYKVFHCSKKAMVCYDCGIKAFLFSSFQYTPNMDFNKFMTLWIFSLCLVEKSWTQRTSSSNSEIQVVENAVSGKIMIILLMCETC